MQKKYRFLFYSVWGLAQIVLYLAVTFFVYAFILFLYAFVFQLKEAIVYVIYPFGSYIAYNIMSVDTLLAFYVITSALFVVISAYAIKKFPLASFMIATKIFSDSFPIVAIIRRGGKTVITFADANFVSYIIVHAKYSTLKYIAIISGAVFVIIAEYLIVLVILYKGIGSLPTTAKVLAKPLLGVALLTVIVIHELGHVFFGLLCGLSWTGFGLLFPVGAFVTLAGQISPEAGVLVAAGGNIFVTIYLIATKNIRNKFIRMTRIIGAQLTLLNSMPAFGFASYPIKIFLYAAIDGSQVLLYGLMSFFAFPLALLFTIIPIYISLETLKEERLA